MLGDWIKMLKGLSRNPRVWQLRTVLNLESNQAVIGYLHDFWSWADDVSIDGELNSTTERDIDGLVHLQGFASAMREVGWLDGEDGCLILPNFTEHNGQSAKRRSSGTKRMAKKRKLCAPDADKCAHDERTKCAPERDREIYTTTATTSACVRGDVNNRPRDMDEVIALMRAVPTPPPTEEELQSCAQKFHDEFEASGWVDRFGNPLVDWRPKARQYATKWGKNCVLRITDVKRGVTSGNGVGSGNRPTRRGGPRMDNSDLEVPVWKPDQNK